MTPEVNVKHTSVPISSQFVDLVIIEGKYDTLLTTITRTRRFCARMRDDGGDMS